MNSSDSKDVTIAENPSLCEISVLSGTSINIWGDAETDPATTHQATLQIEPDRPAVIGRSEGGKVPYLDPAYRATTIVPGSQETVLLHAGDGPDTYVSRGHFMLRAAAGGVVLVNGVPAVGGGIRPPKNWTRLLSPVHRGLEPAEEYLIESGSGITIQLPNKSVIHIDAR